MIIVVTSSEYNKATLRHETMVSHGVNQSTGENVVLPQVKVSELDALYDREIGEYIFED